MKKLESAYNSSLQFAKSHYENFPVVSFSFPKEKRKHVAVIYRFARQADDLADEGIVSPDDRIRNLNQYEDNFRKCLSREFESDFWEALSNTVIQKKLNPKNFFDLLDAFKQDVTKNRYQDFNQLLHYCSRSANPVGRIMLELFGVNDEKAFEYSDSICTALQLTNFYQDVSIDYRKNRIYLPFDEMQKFGVIEKIFDEKQNNANFKKLMEFQIDRAYDMFAEGRKLFGYLPKSLLPQIKMTILGGEMILQKIVKMDFDVLHSRPHLTKMNYLGILVKGIFSDAG